jgi:beta-lactamase superfamily II metal-dependent hydrolase
MSTGELKVHFLNVGHGDCTVIKHPSGRITIVDIHNGSELDDDSENEILKALGWSDLKIAVEKATGASKNQLLEKAGYNIPRTNPIEFLKQNYPGERAFRYIQTHPEMDHMRGLKALASNIGYNCFWDTANTKETPEFHPFNGENDREDWEEYQRVRNGDNVIHNLRRHVGKYWLQDDNGGSGDRIEILSPTSELIAQANKDGKWNNLSYVLRLTHAGRSIILGGDACVEAWDDIYAAYGINLAGVSVLKASHHGRESGFHEDAVKAMKPWMTVLSVGKKPSTDAHQSYKKYSEYVWSTRWKGNVTVTVDANGQVTANSQYNAEQAA